MPDRAAKPHLILEDLEDGTEDDLVIGRSHDGVRFVGIDLSEERLHDRELIECEIVEATLNDVVLTGARWREVALQGCEATEMKLDKAELREVWWRDSRLGVVNGYEIEARRLAFTDCRLGYLNLRGSDLNDVTFERCQIGDLDLAEAQVNRMTVVDSAITTLHTAAAKLLDVDLRAASLEDVASPDQLRGVTIGPEQLSQLAPSFAKCLGIDIG